MVGSAETLNTGVGTDEQSALTASNGLAASGRAVEAIELLTAANRRQRSTLLERRLVRLRHEAFDQLDRSTPRWPWDDDWPRSIGADALPVIARDELSAAVVRDAVLRRGCAYIPGLFATAVETLVDAIDRAFDAHDAHLDGATVDETAPWWEPFDAGDRDVAGTRKWVRDGGGVWTAESPRALFLLLDLAEQVGLRQLLTEYFGERPAFSVGKSTLRRVSLDSGGEWHQDGAFLGGGRTLNMWLALTECGEGADAPGLEILPRRLDYLVETGTFGTWFEWAVAPPEAKAAAGDVAFLRPRFQAGDVLLFDDLFLHRTCVDASMTRERHAIENWFFAPSEYPEKQIPLVW